MKQPTFNSRPVDDIQVRSEETDAEGVAHRRIEFASFAEGEYVESFFVEPIRASDLYRHLGQLLGVTINSSADLQALIDANDSISIATGEAPASSPDRVVPVCPRCGSDNVAVDAAARWSTHDQNWEVSNIFDKGCGCDECGAEDIAFDWITEQEDIERTAKPDLSA